MIYWYFSLQLLRFASYLIFLTEDVGGYQFILVMHLLAAITAYLILLKSIKSRWQVNVLTAVDLFIPFFGLAMILLYMMMHQLFFWRSNKQVKTIYDDRLYLEGLEFSDFYDKASLEQENNIEFENRLFDNYQIEPYADLFEGSNISLQLDAINKLCAQRDKNSVRLLRKALQSKTYEVRYFAKTSLEKLEQDVFDQIDSLSENIDQHPNDVENYNSRSFFYLELVKSELVDEALYAMFLEKALYDTLFSLQLDEKQAYSFVRIIEIYTLLKRYQDVVDTCCQALQLGLPREENTKIEFYMAEAHFHLKDFSAVRGLANKILSNQPDHEIMQDTLKVWCPSA